MRTEREYRAHFEPRTTHDSTVQALGLGNILRKIEQVSKRAGQVVMMKGSTTGFCLPLQQKRPRGLPARGEKGR